MWMLFYGVRTDPVSSQHPERVFWGAFLISFGTVEDISCTITNRWQRPVCLHKAVDVKAKVSRWSNAVSWRYAESRALRFVSWIVCFKKKGWKKNKSVQFWTKRRLLNRTHFSFTPRTEMSLLRSYFQGNRLIWSFHTKIFYFFYFLSAGEPPRALPSLLWSCWLLNLPSGSAPFRRGRAGPPRCASCCLRGHLWCVLSVLGAFFQSFFFFLSRCICPVSTPAVCQELYREILQGDHRLKS